MAVASSILSDSSLLSRLDRCLFKLETALAIAGGAVIFAVVLMAVVNILGRTLFDIPIPIYDDLSSLSLPFIAFLGFSYTLREGGHIRMDLLVGRFKGRMLWFMESGFALLIVLMTIILLIGTYHDFIKSTEGSNTANKIPEWPARLVIVVMFAVALCRSLLQFLSFGKAFIYNIDHPVAVPLIEDPAALALKEAESVS